MLKTNKDEHKRLLKSAVQQYKDIAIEVADERDDIKGAEALKLTFKVIDMMLEALTGDDMKEALEQFIRSAIISKVITDSKKLGEDMGYSTRQVKVSGDAKPKYVNKLAKHIKKGEL